MKFILSLFLLFFSLNLYANVKNVLLLHSYYRGLPWSDNISLGVENSLKNRLDVDLRTEYIGGNDIYSKELIRLNYRILYNKLKSQKYDIVVASDNIAVDFVLKYKNRLFNGLPIVFCGLYEDNPGIDVPDVLSKNISVVFENKQVLSSVEYIQKLIPKTKHVYIINGPSPASKFVNKQIKKIIQKKKEQLKITLNDSGNIEKIKEDLQTLSTDSVVLFGSMARDLNQKNVSLSTINSLIKHSLVPVFSLVSTYRSFDIVGGLMTSGVNQGKEAAKIVLKHLDKEKVDFSKPIFAPSEFLFKYPILKKYDISFDNIPSTALLINQPQSFFEKHNEFVKKVFIASPFILIFLIIALINIYKRHQMAKRLIAQNYREQVLLNNVKSAIFWIDNDGVVQGCNNSFCEFVSSKKEDILGRTLCDVFEVFCQLPSKEELFLEKDIEFCIDKQTFITRSKTFLDENQNSGGVVVIIANITEKKQLEINKQFIIQQSKLAEVGEMLSAIVHQWKVPLVDLSAIAHKLKHYYEMNRLKGDDINYFYDVIMKQIVYMGNTIDNFRDFIRPSAKPTFFSIDIGLQEILSILESSMKYNSIELIYENKIEPSYKQFGYPNEFKQVLLNIINNAKDAILEAREEKKRNGKILIETKEDKNMVYLFICDDGKGIDESALPKLFEPFFSTKANGDGFGLYMAKLIIENKMNGSIQMKNLQDGAQVIISLPKSQ